MSTKTSIKRIALVAVSTLGFGLLSVVPARAANDESFVTTSLNISRYTTTPTVGASVAFNFGGVFGESVGDAFDAGDSTDFTAALTAYPSGGFVSMTAADTTAAGAAVSLAIATDVITADGPTVTLEAGAADYAGGTVTSSRTVGMGSFSFTPTKSGSFTLTVWNDKDQDGQIDPLEARQTLDFTVGAAIGWSSGLSTKYLALPGTVPAAASGAELYGATAVKTIETHVANVWVTIKNASGALYTGQTVTATMSGSGFVNGASTDAADPLDPAAAEILADEGNAPYSATRSKSVVDDAGAVLFAVYADGTAGTGTITISVTDQVSGATTVLGSESVTFTGSVTKFVLAEDNYKIARAGGYDTGKYDAMETRDAATKIPAFTFKAEDSNGNAVGGLTLAAGLTSDASVVAPAVCAEDDGSSDDYSTGGPGYWNCYFTTANSSVSGNSATLTVRTLNPADATSSTYISLEYPITIGGSRTGGTVTLTLDKASYEPGERMVLTYTAKDASGNPVYDGITQAAAVANKSVTGLLGGTYDAGTIVIGDTELLFAPTAPGAFTLTASSGTATGATVSVSATVGDDAATSAATAASDAALEAIDAANAATDAANLAAEAADAATVAAEEARDAADAATAAVEALASDIAEMTAALKAQITTLAKTVAKIAKKVKA